MDVPNTVDDTRNGKLEEYDETEIHRLWVTMDIDGDHEEGGYLELKYENNETDGGMATTSSSFGAIERTNAHGEGNGYH